MRVSVWKYIIHIVYLLCAAATHVAISHAWMAKTCRRYTMCIITNKCTKVCESIIHLSTFVGFDVISNCPVQVCGSFIIEAFLWHNPWFLTKWSKKKVMESTRRCLPSVRIWRQAGMKVDLGGAVTSDEDGLCENRKTSVLLQGGDVCIVSGAEKGGLLSG